MPNTGVLATPDSDLANIVLGYYATPAPPVFVTVPNLIGLSAADAITAITALGLVPSGPGAGTVSFQAPAAGTTALVGSTVTYTVGPPPPPPAGKDYYFSPPATTTKVPHWHKIPGVRSPRYRAFAFSTNYAPGETTAPDGTPGGQGGVQIGADFYAGGRWYGPLTDAQVNALVAAGFTSEVIPIDPGHLEQLPAST